MLLRGCLKNLGIDEYYAEVLLHQKIEVVKEIKGEELYSRYGGDGVNDAFALVEADVGIVIGVSTDIAIISSTIANMLRNEFPHEQEVFIDKVCYINYQLAMKTMAKCFDIL